MKPIPFIILAPLIAHPVWALLMFLSPLSLHTMGIDATYKVLSNPTIAAFFMFVASGTAWASHYPKWLGNWRGFMLIIPQQFLMLLSLWTIGVSILTATYANGYAPPEGWWFIATDQVFFATACTLHSVKVWQIYITKKP